MKIKFYLNVFFVTFFLCVINCAFAQSKKVYAAKVYSIDRQVHHGILTVVDDKGIHLVEKTGADVFVAADNIRKIKIYNKKAASTGLTLGLLTGLAAGGTAAAIFHTDDKLVNTALIVGGVWTTFLGAVIGGKIGGHAKENVVVAGDKQIYNQHMKDFKAYISEVR